MMLRCTWLVPPAMRPPGAASRPAASGPSSIAVGTGRVGAQHGHLEHHLGDAELEQRAAVVAIAPCRAGAGRALVGGARRRSSDASRWRADGAEPPLGAERAELLQPPLERDDGRADVAALVRQHAHPDAPAAVQRAEQAVGRQRDVGEEDLVELGRRRSSGAAGGSRCPAGPSGRGRTRCRRAWRRPGSVRAMRMPQSLTRPPEHHTFWPLTTKWSPSRSARVDSDAEVAAGAGLGEQLAPHVVAAQRRPAGAGACCSGVP